MANQSKTTKSNSTKKTTTTKSSSTAKKTTKTNAETKTKSLDKQPQLEVEKTVVEGPKIVQETFGFGIKKGPKKPDFISTTIFYYKKYWHMSIWILIFIVLGVLCSIALPLLTYQMTSSATSVGGSDPSAPIKYWGLEWKPLLYIAIGIVVFNMIISFFSQYVAALLGRKVEIDLRDKALESLVRQDISYYSDKKIGELLTKVISDTQIVGDQSSQVPVSIITAILQMAGALVMMFMFDWQLSLVVVVAFFIVLVSMMGSFVVTKKRYSKMREVITEINGNVTDRISNVRLIKSTGTENYETERFNEVHKEYYKKAETLAKIQSLMVTILFGGITAMQFATVGAAMILHAGKTGDNFFFTTFASFNLAQGILIGPLFQIVMAAVGVAQASVAAQRVDTTINAKSIMNPHYWDGKKVDNLNGNIIFKDVEFAYPEKPTKTILPKFDFTFEKGKSYAFVGETGSGKSTISRLLLRFYDPTHGKVLINGKTDLKDVNLASYLDHIGYVEQEPQILYGDVFENIKYGRFDSTDEQVIEAAKKAELHDLIMSWPDGYKTILGERGFMLSGGQKQRMIIARMFLKDPEFLILDEATSALDNIIEKEIQEKLEILMEGRTTVSIAHRLSTIKNADQIIVLGANGKGIVQTGTFDELKSKPGHFQNLYKAGLMD